MTKPSLSRRLRSHPWFREVVAVGWPIAFYWIGVILSLVVFTICVLVSDGGPDTEDFFGISGVWFGAISGAAVGQLASITRLRSSLFQPSMMVAFFLATYVFILYEDQLSAVFGQEMSIALWMLALMGSVFASGGFWSLRVNRGLLAFWGPTLLATGSILIVTQKNNYDEAWHEGSKYAIWSFSTVTILFVAIVLQILFMAARERHRVHRWMSAPAAAEQVSQRPDPIRPLAGLGTWIVLGMLMLALTFSSAVVAPYLWRTGPGEGSGDTIDSDGEDEGHGQSEADGEKEQEGSGGMDPQGAQQAMKLIQQVVSMMCTLLTMLILSIAALIIFGPPTRRQLLLTHLREPMWPVTTSRRAHLHWRLAEIAMGDAGIHRSAGETALELAERTVAAFPDINLEALTSAATIADRVAYGYTLDASDADTIGRAAEMTYQAVWDSIGELERLKNTYRFL